ncbi:MAG: DUF6044 family protein [Desulfovibrio sp.]|jgi:hypothetical protein|nr:DUF6044 family protein [Desulfovibrio sp.]
MRRFLIYSLCALAAISLHSRAYFLDWPNIPIHIHDFLDMLFPWKHLGAGILFNSEEFRSFIPARLTGMGNYLNLHLGGFFFALFSPPQAALLIHKISCHFLGFAGMYLLLGRIIPANRRKSLFCAFFALQFALLPLYYDQITFTSTAIIPFLAWALLSIALDGWNVRRALVLVLCPFFSFLLHAPIFLFALYAVFLIYRQCRGHSMKNGLAALALCLGLYLISHYDYVLMSVGYDGFALNRADYLLAALNRPQDYTLALAVQKTLTMLIDGQYHVNTFQRQVLLPVCAAVFIVNCLASGKMRSLADEKLSYARKIQIVLFLTIIFCAFTQGLFAWLPIVRIKESLPIVSMIKMRFWYLNQILWYSCFAIACWELLCLIYRLAPASTPKGLLTALLFLVASAQFVIIELRSTDTMPKTESSFQQFFAPELFARVSASIPENKKDFRTVTFGMSPTISSFNGFRGIDLYEPTYSLDHKREFRKIIAAELEKDPVIREYFDDWGSRCYIFQAHALDWMRNESKAQHVDLNYEQLRQMNVSYIVSSVAMDTENSADIELVSITPRLSPQESYWENIYVYKIKSK